LINIGRKATAVIAKFTIVPGINGQIAFFQPIAETFQRIFVAKVQGSTEQLQFRINHLKFRFERRQAIVATGYQHHCTHHRGELTRKLVTDPGGRSGNQDRAPGEIGDAHSFS